MNSEDEEELLQTVKFAVFARPVSQAVAVVSTVSLFAFGGQTGAFVACGAMLVGCGIAVGAVFRKPKCSKKIKTGSIDPQ